MVSSGVVLVDMSVDKKPAILVGEKNPPTLYMKGGKSPHLNKRRSRRL
jgi:hypothetical protein